MTAVNVAPRVENPTSATESIASRGFVQIRPSKAYSAGGQWVLPVWSDPVMLTGASIPFDLDPLTDVPYELYVEIPDGRGGSFKMTEFRIVADPGPVDWEDLVQVDGPGGDPVLTNVVDARLDILEANAPTGGASTLAGISDMTGVMRTFNASVSYSAARVLLSAAPIDSPTFTTTAAAPTPTAGDATTKIATTAFVDTSFAKKASPTLTGTPLAPTATAGTSTTQIATTAFVDTSYAAKASPTLTGTPLAPTAVVATNTTQIATTAYVKTVAASAVYTPAATSFTVACAGGVGGMVTRPTTRTDVTVYWRCPTAPVGGGYPNAESVDIWLKVNP